MVKDCLHYAARDRVGFVGDGKTTSGVVSRVNVTDFASRLYNHTRMRYAA